MKFKYKGRSFSSAATLTSAIQREIKQDYEKSIRSAARGTGVQIRKSGDKFLVDGNSDQLGRILITGFTYCA